MISVRQKPAAETAGDRIIIALDVESAAQAREIVSELKDHVGAFKVGLQLFTNSGSEFVRELADAGIKVRKL